MLVLLLFTATLTPFEVALLKIELNTLFVVNRLVDILFITVRTQLQPTLYTRTSSLTRVLPPPHPGFSLPAASHAFDYGFTVCAHHP